MHDKKQYDRDYYYANVERLRAARREYYHRNKAKISEQRRLAHAADPTILQRHREQGALYRAANGDKVRAAQRASRLRHLESHRAKDRVKARERRARDGDRIRARERARHAAKKNSGAATRIATQPPPEAR